MPDHGVRALVVPETLEHGAREGRLFAPRWEAVRAGRLSASPTHETLIASSAARRSGSPEVARGASREKIREVRRRSPERHDEARDERHVDELVQGEVRRRGAEVDRRLATRGTPRSWR